MLDKLIDYYRQAVDGHEGYLASWSYDEDEHYYFKYNDVGELCTLSKEEYDFERGFHSCLFDVIEKLKEVRDNEIG